jgi:riboflavin kinase / FMN adenylyltransferase
MQPLSSLKSYHLKNTWLTIGSFDGVHRGHQEIVKKLSSGAHAVGAQAVVLTFYPHPAKVLGKRTDFYYLTSPEERAVLLGEMGIDFVITYPFDLEVAATSARDFVKEIHTHLGFRHLWIGHDFALGRKREGDAPTLRRLGDEFGFQVEIVNQVKVQDFAVSSSQIRALIREGKVDQAELLLGRPYIVKGKVVPGDGRGRTIGIPTANLKVWEEKLLPGSGVYVCQAWVGGEQYGAVTNIGVRPTFDQQEPTPHLEAHLLDFDEDLYGQEVALEFIQRLRDEQRFPNPQALVTQINKDIKQGRLVLSEKTKEKFR